MTVLAVKELLPHWQFTAVRGQRKGVPHKPDPAGALELAAELRLQPAEFLYMGDTNTDMQTASAAGMQALGCLWGFRTAEELREAGAFALIEHPLDALQFLKS